MKINLNIKSKIILFILTPITVFILFLILFVGIRNTNRATTNAENLMKQVAEKHAKQATAILNKYVTNVYTLANSFGGNYQYLSDNQRKIYGNILYNTSETDNSDVWAIWKSEVYGDSNYMDKEWILLQPSDGYSKVNDFTFDFENRYGSCLETSTTTVSAPYEFEGAWKINITSPIFNNGEICGFAGITIKNTEFESITIDDTFSGTQIFVINQDDKCILSNTQSPINEYFTFSGDTASIASFKKMIANGDFATKKMNINGQETFTLMAPVKVEKIKFWSVGLLQPSSITTNKEMHSLFISILSAVIGLIIICIIIIIVAHNITKPITETTEALKYLAQGDTENIKTLNVRTNDELEEMSESLNMVVDGMRKSETFALNIGEGKFDSDFHTLSDKDRLGEALIKMRENLLENKKEETARKEEEELRNWATEGIAKFADILRKDQNNMKSLGFNIMSNLIDYLNVSQGALFVVNNDNEDDIFFSLITAIAYGRDKYVKKDIREGEGLIGRCIYERKTIYLTDVPDNYMRITSGLGTANPKCILIVPCTLNEEIFGIIEIASFTELKPYEIDFVEKLGESIASTVASVKVTEKTAKLLQASQEQSNELTSREEELRQNLEEMEATQEDLHRQMEDNQRMKEELTKEKILMDSLMDNINDTIYFKDIDSKFIKVSKSYLRIAEVESYDDVLGKTDFDLCSNKEEAQMFFDDEQRIIKSRKPIINQVQEEHRNGTVIYTSTSKYPLNDEYGNVIGTFGITTDITESIKKNINK